MVIITCRVSLRCQRQRLSGHWMEQVEDRSWPQHEVVVIWHDFAVKIARACQL